MSFSPALLVQILFLLALLASYGLAIHDWGRATPGELAGGRRPGRALALAALTLLALATLAVLAGGGQGALRNFFAGSGLFWLLQAVGLKILVETGGLWAGRAGVQPFAPTSLRRFPWRILGGLVLAMLLVTLALLWLWPHEVSAGPFESWGLMDMPAPLRFLFLFCILSLAPLLEECLFRHYLLYRLAHSLRRTRFPMALALILSSLLFAIGHEGLVHPFALKLTQTFAFGLLLGLIARRHGLYAAIALHWVFNASLLLPMLFDRGA